MGLIATRARHRRRIRPRDDGVGPKWARRNARQHAVLRPPGRFAVVQQQSIRVTAFGVGSTTDDRLPALEAVVLTEPVELIVRIEHERGVLEAPQWISARRAEPDDEQRSAAKTEAEPRRGRVGRHRIVPWGLVERTELGQLLPEGFMEGVVVKRIGPSEGGNGTREWLYRTFLSVKMADNAVARATAGALRSIVATDLQAVLFLNTPRTHSLTKPKASKMARRIRPP